MQEATSRPSTHRLWRGFQPHFYTLANRLHLETHFPIMEVLEMVLEDYPKTSSPPPLEREVVSFNS